MDVLFRRDSYEYRAAFVNRTLSAAEQQQQQQQLCLFCLSALYAVRSALIALSRFCLLCMCRTRERNAGADLSVSASAVSVRSAGAVFAGDKQRSERERSLTLSR